MKTKQNNYLIINIFYNNYKIHIYDLILIESMLQCIKYYHKKISLKNKL